MLLCTAGLAASSCHLREMQDDDLTVALKIPLVPSKNHPLANTLITLGPMALLPKASSSTMKLSKHVANSGDINYVFRLCIKIMYSKLSIWEPSMSHLGADVRE